jgi:hypothetical protein
MTQMRQSILMILSIVAIALAAVLVIRAPHNRALAQPGSERFVQDFVVPADRIAGAGTVAAASEDGKN